MILKWLHHPHSSTRIQQSNKLMLKWISCQKTGGWHLLWEIRSEVGMTHRPWLPVDAQCDFWPARVMTLNFTFHSRPRGKLLAATLATMINTHKTAGALQLFGWLRQEERSKVTDVQDSRASSASLGYPLFISLCTQTSVQSALRVRLNRPACGCDRR